MGGKGCLSFSFLAESEHGLSVNSHVSKALDIALMQSRRYVRSTSMYFRTLPGTIITDDHQMSFIPYGLRALDHVS